MTFIREYCFTKFPTKHIVIAKPTYPRDLSGSAIFKILRSQYSIQLKHYKSLLDAATISDKPLMKMRKQTCRKSHVRLAKKPSIWQDFRQVIHVGAYAMKIKEHKIESWGTSFVKRDGSDMWQTNYTSCFLFVGKLAGSWGTHQFRSNQSFGMLSRKLSKSSYTRLSARNYFRVQMVKLSFSEHNAFKVPVLSCLNPNWALWSCFSVSEYNLSAKILTKTSENFARRLMGLHWLMSTSTSPFSLWIKVTCLSFQ